MSRVSTEGFVSRALCSPMVFPQSLCLHAESALLHFHSAFWHWECMSWNSTAFFIHTLMSSLLLPEISPNLITIDGRAKMI
jgi:hypothetical protein